MTRLEILRSAYSQYDTIYAGLILVAVWVAGTGHQLDMMCSGAARKIIPIYWTLVIVLYVAGVLCIGLMPD